MVEIVETPTMTTTSNCNNENSVSCTNQRINDATNNNTNNNDEEKTSHHSISSNKTNNTSSNNKSVIDSRAYSIETYEKRFQDSLKKLNAQVEYIFVFVYKKNIKNAQFNFNFF